MKTTSLYIRIKTTVFGFLMASLVLSCGSFQGASYFDSDGIYATQTSVRYENPKASKKSDYYTQYFQSVAEDGYVEPSADEIYFTDTDSYNGTQQNVVVEESYSQIPWGGQTSQTEIVLIDNRPNFSWGLSGFAFNFSPFWNNYYGNPYRFGFGRFYSPFFNRPFWNPYGGYADFWGGFDPFYSPFSYYGGFYNPYGFGYRNPWNYRNNRWNRFNDFYGNNHNWRNNRDYRSTVARIKSGRGEKTYPNDNSRSRQNAKEARRKTQNIENTLNRINLGRDINSVGRRSIVGYDRNRAGITSGGNVNPSNVLPIGGVVSRSRNLGLSQGNINITKGSTDVSRSTGRVQAQYRLPARNPNRTSTQAQNTRPVRVLKTPARTYNRNTNQVQQSNRGQNATRSYNSTPNTKSSYTRSNKTYNNNQSYGRSSSSGSNRSSFSSGSSSRSSGRSSSSSRSSGRRN